MSKNTNNTTVNTSISTNITVAPQSKVVSIKSLVANNNLVVNRSIMDDVANQPIGKLEWHSPGDLYIDEDVQRDLNTRHALDIAKIFNFYSLKPATGFRDSNGMITIIDGQHTMTAAYTAGADRVPVYVHEIPHGMSLQAAKALQSRAFLGTNTQTRAVGRYDIYKNKLTQARADEEAFKVDPTHPCPDAKFLEIEAMCQRTNSYPGPSTKAHRAIPGSITHIKNLTTAYFNIGPKASEEALVYLRKYFPNETIHGAVYLGLVYFISNLAKATKNGRPDAVWDPVILYKAITKDGLNNMEKSYFDLQNESKLMGYAMNTQAQKWLAGTIRRMYNMYITDNALTTPTIGVYV